jgi:translation initiation factor IF-2
MGHVDHGKTTLLDSLRKSSIAAGEAGGITQHIGAFSVELPSGKKITFLDTPGHAAFSHMRKRGAQVTDIVVLVVAADDGVMPQTIEAIKHSLEAGVPIIVAVNKCDKPGVDPLKIKQDLLRYDIVVEELGGEIPAIHVSGKTGMGLAELEENILAIAEISDYRGDPTGLVEAVVVESQQTSKLGNIATVIVKRGTLTPGAFLVAGNSWCKVKKMVDEYGRELTKVLPSNPVKVLGWKNLPNAGDHVLQAENEVLQIFDLELS